METVEELVAALTDMGCRIATAESCTGGMVASSIVDVPGASLVFEEGYITYSNRVKERLLGVPSETIAQNTVVSEEVAIAMACGLQERTGADLTVSVTGYAGPEGGEDGTPVGTVYIGTWYREKAEAGKFQFPGDRMQVRRQAADQALVCALERIKKGE